jgi:hypothetical protein
MTVAAARKPGTIEEWRKEQSYFAQNITKKNNLPQPRKSVLGGNPDKDSLYSCNYCG